MARAPLSAKASGLEGAIEHENAGESDGDGGGGGEKGGVNLPDFLRAEGNAAFRAGRNDDAVRLYSLAIEKILLFASSSPNAIGDANGGSGGGRVNVLFCNRAIAHFRAGMFVEAREDALQSFAHSTDVQQKAKAKYWEAKALVVLHREPEAIDALRIGLRMLPHDTKLTQELEDRVHKLSSAQLAKLWSSIIDHAARPGAMSSRDGKFLKPVPSKEAIDTALLAQTLASLFDGGWEVRPVWERGEGESPATNVLRHEAAAMLCKSWARGKDFPAREAMALFRALAYLKCGNCAQGMKDANVAVAYSREPGWPRALAVKALAHECTALSAAASNTTTRQQKATAGTDVVGGVDPEVTLAALEIARAIELHDTSTDLTYQSARVERGHEKAEFEALMCRLLPRISDAHRAALAKGGSKSLEEWLEEEKEQSKPEYLRKRPKYYYYYEWMRRRIDEHCPALPEPVVDKLLTMDSNELDLLLQHESAIKGQAQEFLEVLERDGVRALETYTPASLTWEEVKALKGPGTIGLGHGTEAAAPGAGFLECERDTDHALIGGRGEAGMLTDAEKQVPGRGGRTVVPMLPPDQSRDTSHVVDAFAREQRAMARGETPLLTLARHASAAAADADADAAAADVEATRDAFQALNARQRSILKGAQDAIAAADPEKHRPTTHLSSARAPAEERQ